MDKDDLLVLLEIAKSQQGPAKKAAVEALTHWASTRAMVAENYLNAARAARKATQDYERAERAKRQAAKAQA